MAVTTVTELRCQPSPGFKCSWLSRNRHEKAIHVSWVKPDMGWTKLNFDGSFREKSGVSSIGGAFRNHKAEFILGYSDQIGRTTSAVAELAALRRRLEFVLENGWDNVWLEGDPKTLVEIILSRRKVKCEQVHSLVRDINLIIPQLNNCHFSHIYREGNRVADTLARMGHETKYRRIWWNVPPKEILDVIRADAEGKGVSQKV